VLVRGEQLGDVEEEVSAVSERPTGWYWVPAEPGEKVDRHPGFYDADRDQMGVAQCNGSGWGPRAP
jgi:hypothetical protein